MRAPVRVGFVCSGNICRSPTAEAVLTRLAEAEGMAELVAADSFGTGGWHVGEDMDARSRQTLADAGYTWPAHTARQFTAADFDDHDLVVALDSGHRAALLELAARADDPTDARRRIVLLRRFDPEVADGADGAPADVADPYYGGPTGFSTVLGQIERACRGLLTEIRSSWL